MRSSLRRFGFSLLVLGAGFLAACGSDDDSTDPTGPDLSAIAGTWNLQTANGSALPVPLSEDGQNFTLDGGRMVLNSNGTCTNGFTTTPEGEAQKTETLSCTFSLSGNSFSLSESSGTYSGTLNGNELTVINDGNSLLYTR